MTEPVPEVVEGCTCYLGDPTDPTRDPEACGPCDAAFWRNPVFILVDDD